MPENYPDKAVCGLFGMYMQEMIDAVDKPGYPVPMMDLLNDIHDGFKDLTYESCLPDDVLASIQHATEVAVRDPTEANIHRIREAVGDAMLSYFSEETAPGYTPGRYTGSNRRY